MKCTDANCVNVGDYHAPYECVIVEIVECHSRDCNKKGDRVFAVIADDGKEYCSSECAISESLEE